MGPLQRTRLPTMSKVSALRLHPQRQRLTSTTMRLMRTSFLLMRIPLLPALSRLLLRMVSLLQALSLRRLKRSRVAMSRSMSTLQPAFTKMTMLSSASNVPMTVLKMSSHALATISIVLIVSMTWSRLQSMGLLLSLLSVAKLQSPLTSTLLSSSRILCTISCGRNLRRLMSVNRVVSMNGVISRFPLFSRFRSRRKRSTRSVDLVQKKPIMRISVTCVTRLLKRACIALTVATNAITAERPANATGGMAASAVKRARLSSKRHIFRLLNLRLHPFEDNESSSGAFSNATMEHVVPRPRIELASTH